MVEFAVFAVKNHLYVFIHNGVGSALLVLTMMGIPEPRGVGRVTYSSYAFSVYWLPFGELEAKWICFCYEKDAFCVALPGVDVKPSFLS